MVNLSYCVCGDLLEVGSPAKGSRMLGWLGQLTDGQKTCQERENVSKVSPGMGWWQYVGSGSFSTPVHGSMVVNATNPHR